MQQSLPPDEQSFRQAMSLFATGVTVLMVKTLQGDPVGMTANAVASLSLNPMLLLVCVDKKANMAPHILRAAGFSVCILSQNQEEISNYFAGRLSADQRPPFNLVDWAGGPLLEGCMAGLGCTKVEVHEGGDHWIVIGRVVALHSANTPLEPLIFYGSRYRHLEAVRR
jgi:flavin reductase (DIM6/NTAB) family NADH-FMN oxidoreductase RutF